jgi:hypothetical protein
MTSRAVRTAAEHGDRGQGPNPSGYDAFLFDQKIGPEADEVRRSIDLGMETTAGFQAN